MPYEYDSIPIRRYIKPLKFKIQYGHDILIKIKFKLQIKTQNTTHEQKLKKKKNGAKPRPNWHETTIRHSNKIVFTQQSTIAASSNIQKDTKQTTNNNININTSNKESDN
jgi:hypothetical protein